MTDKIANLTYVYRLRAACRDFLELPDIVKADDLEEAILKISQIGIRALYDAIEQYREFCDLPGIRQQLESYLQVKKHPRDSQ